MRKALAIAAKDLRLRIRDRSAFILGFLVPFGLAGIFSLTLADVDDAEDFSVTFAVVDLDGGELGAAFVDVVRDIDVVELQEAASASEAEQLAEDGEIDAAFVIPEGFSGTVTAGSGGELRVITDPRSDIGSLLARSIARSFASDVDAVQVAIATALAAGAPHEEGAALAERAAGTAAATRLDRDTREGRLLSSTTFYAIGMAVFFVFFTVEFGVRSLLDERQEGTLARLLVAPLRPVWIVGGKVVASFLLGLVSMTALIVASSAFLGADWGDALSVALLVLFGVCAAIGITALVATLAKTPAQAAGYTSIVAVVLGLFGGTFFPVSQGPSFLSNLSLLTPQAWMMRGFSDTASGGGLADVLPALGALLAFTLVMGAVAIARSRRMVAR